VPPDKNAKPLPSDLSRKSIRMNIHRKGVRLSSYPSPRNFMIPNSLEMDRLQPTKKLHSFGDDLIILIYKYNIYSQISNFLFFVVQLFFEKRSPFREIGFRSESGKERLTQKLNVS